MPILEAGKRYKCIKDHSTDQSYLGSEWLAIERRGTSMFMKLVKTVKRSEFSFELGYTLHWSFDNPNLKEINTKKLKFSDILK